MVLFAMLAALMFCTKKVMEGLPNIHLCGMFIMTFTALTGAVSHFVMGGIPDLTCLALCVVFTLVFARIAALIANRASTKLLNRITGGILVALGVVILGVQWLG